MKRSLPVLVAIPTLAALLAACGGTTNQSASAKQPSASAKQQITLVLDYTLPLSNAATQYYVNSAKLYERAHPDVKVVVRPITFQQMEDSAPLMLSGSSVPSLYYDNQGYGAIYKLAADHLIVPLTSYASKYRWASFTNNSWLLDFDGEVNLATHQIGTGTLYGVSNALEPMGVFYNRSMLAKLGQPVPKTLQQFEHDMALSKAAGEVPLAIGGQVTAYNLGELWGLLAGADAKTPSQIDLIRQLELGNPKASWTAPVSLEAARQIRSWYNDGYFPPGVLSVSQDSAQDLLVSGKALFNINYSVAAAVFNPMKTNVGFFMLPSAYAGHDPAPIMVGNQPWTIPTHGPDHAQAAALLNYLLFNHSSGVRYFREADAVAIDTPHSVIDDASPLAKEVAQSSFDALTWPTDLGYPGDNTPDSLNLINELLQEVSAGKLSASSFGAKMEADFQSFRSTLK